MTDRWDDLRERLQRAEAGQAGPDEAIGIPVGCGTRANAGYPVGPVLHKRCRTLTTNRSTNAHEDRWHAWWDRPMSEKRNPIERNP